MKSLSKVDVCIASIGDMTKEKMELLNRMWSLKIRTEANYSIEASSTEIQEYC